MVSEHLQAQTYLYQQFNCNDRSALTISGFPCDFSIATSCHVYCWRMVIHIISACFTHSVNGGVRGGQSVLVSKIIFGKVFQTAEFHLLMSTPWFDTQVSVFMVCLSTFKVIRSSNQVHFKQLDSFEPRVAVSMQRLFDSSFEWRNRSK